MRQADIQHVVDGLLDAAPGSYPRGGPNTEDGWKMWRAVEYALSCRIAECTKYFARSRWDEIIDPSKRQKGELQTDYDPGVVPRTPRDQALVNALRAIRDGHNDPRKVAREALGDDTD